MSQLTFAKFKEANVRRDKYFGDLGVLTLDDWFKKLLGEILEANGWMQIIREEKKKLVPDREKIAYYQQELRKEYGDILTYLDLMAESDGISLEEVAVSKFNEISDRKKYPIKIYKGEIVEIDKIQNSVYEVVCDTLHVEDGTFDNNTILENICEDSLELSNLFLALENNLSVQIDDEDWEQLKTIGDVVDYIHKKKD